MLYYLVIDFTVVIFANATLIAHLINLYFDLAARMGVEVQNAYIIPPLKGFFSRFHSYYINCKDEETQTIYKSILISIKKQSIFKKQKLDATLSFYSFELLALLRGLFCRCDSFVETDVASAPVAIA